MELEYEGKKVEFIIPPRHVLLSIIELCNQAPNATVGFIPLLGRDMVTKISEGGRVTWERDRDVPPLIDIHHYGLFYEVGNSVISKLIIGGTNEENRQGRNEEEGRRSENYCNQGQ